MKWDEILDKSLSGQLLSAHPCLLPTDVPSAKIFSVFLLSNQIRHSAFSGLFLSFPVTQGNWEEQLRGQRNENTSLGCVHLKQEGRGNVLLLCIFFPHPFKKLSSFPHQIKEALFHLQETPIYCNVLFWCILVFHRKCSSGLNSTPLPWHCPPVHQKKHPFSSGQTATVMLFTP